MSGNVHELRPKIADSEKITINLGYVDLGQIDLMVQDGFYSNRTDFIRTAIRNQLDRHADVVRQSVARKTLDLGLRHYGREDLEAVRDAGGRLRINVLGLASIAGTSRLSLPVQPSPRSRCWARCTLVQRSRLPWLTGCADLARRIAALPDLTKAFAGPLTTETDHGSERKRPA